MKFLAMGMLLLSGVSCSNIQTRATKYITFYNVKVPPVVKTTAYTQTERDHLKYKKKTAAGTTLIANHSAAADWSQFPIGTKLLIDNKIYVIDDYGSALVKKTGEIPVVDIYQPSKSMMRKYGSKYHTDVQIVELGSFQKSLEILSKRQKFTHCRTMLERIKKQQHLYAYN